MFKGIIEEKGRIINIEHSGEMITMGIQAPKSSKELSVNDSLAVDGVCLTVVSKKGDQLFFNLVPQTLEKTTLGSRHEGDYVNLEQALKIGEGIDGHMVLGHMDCVGKVISVTELEESREMEFEIPVSFQNLIVPRGSIAIDGISLTIAHCSGTRFVVAIIPHTLELTTIGERGEGDQVNIEFDIIGKYVINTLENWREGNQG